MLLNFFVPIISGINKAPPGKSRFPTPPSGSLWRIDTVEEKRSDPRSAQPQERKHQMV